MLAVDMTIDDPHAAETADQTGADHKILLASVAERGDRTAFVTLFSHFAPRIKSMMIKAGAEPALADDLAQEAMLTVWRKAGLYDGNRGSVATWIFTIARNLRIDKLRRQSSRPHQDVADIEIKSDAPDGVAVTEESEIVDKVTVALQALPPAQREVVVLSYVEDMAHGAIAERLGIPVGTVKSRLRLAYEKLRNELEPLR